MKQKQTNKGISKYFVLAPYDIKLNTVSNVTESDSLPPEYVKINTNGICRSGTSGGRIIVKDGLKQIKVPEVSNGISKGDDFHRKWTKLRTQRHY